MNEPTRNVLLVQPRFTPNSFWNYQATCEAIGARYSAAPLGLITVAALLPASWSVRLVDRNAQELRDEDLAWADLVMTGGMLPQQLDLCEVIRLAHARGKKIAVGGPDATCSPDVYRAADFLVIGEAEEVLGDLVAAFLAGAERGVFQAKGFADVKRSPVPRFDLLRFADYLHVGVQLGRGCPFSCEFCNVIELNGRKPRVKETGQMLRELDALYATGYRGHVDFVDDNLIGDRKRVKPFLRELARWNEEHDHPFEYTTEASMNLADDDELLRLMKAANFFAIFVGIETPDPKTLQHAHKKQNLGRDIPAAMKKIFEAGIFVNAGFILGFDGETGPVADAMVDCIDSSAIPVCMVGLLYALPNTQLERRLRAEGRLHADHDRAKDDDADQCTSGLNFTTARPRRAILEDMQAIYRRIYDPAAFFGRVRRMSRDLDMRGHRLNLPLRLLVRDGRSAVRIMWRSGVTNPRGRREFWGALGDCLVHNPRAAKIMMSMAALYLHFEPFSRFIDERLARQLATLRDDEERHPLPVAV